MEGGVDGVDRVDGEGGGGVDVEKTRPWKFRVLDLLVEMLIHGLSDREVVDLLVYAEAVMRGFRCELSVDGKED